MNRTVFGACISLSINKDGMRVYHSKSDICEQDTIRLHWGNELRSQFCIMWKRISRFSRAGYHASTIAGMMIHWIHPRSGTLTFWTTDPFESRESLLTVLCSRSTVQNRLPPQAARKFWLFDSWRKNPVTKVRSTKPPLGWGGVLRS